MTTTTIHQYPPALQAAVDAALAAFPAEADRIHRGAALVANGEIRPPVAGQHGWLIGIHGWEVVCNTCTCPDQVMNGALRCKHWYGKALYRKMQARPAPPVVQSLAYYGEWCGVAGVVTVYNGGDILATFQPHDGMFPVPVPLERWGEVVLGGRKDWIDEYYSAA